MKRLFMLWAGVAGYQLVQYNTAFFGSYIFESFCICLIMISVMPEDCK